MLNKQLLKVVATLGLLISASSCNSKNEYIQKATFDLAPDLKSARVALTFTDKVKANFKTSLPVKTYGSLFTVPFQAGAQSFQVGFDLNMDVIYDNEFVDLEPTLTLPNGMSTGVSYPLLQINAGSLADGAAQFFAYADIRELAWLGMATLIAGIDENFPADLLVSQIFLRDADGMPAVYGSLFGPKLSADGTVAQAGGIAIFANIKALKAARGDSLSAVELQPEAGLEISGPRADYYRNHPRELERINALFMNALAKLQ